MHLRDVLTGHGFDYKAMVVAGQEAVSEAALGVTVERGTPGQRVLPDENRKKRNNYFLNDFINP